MDEKTMLLLKGQSLIMEMLLSMMPAGLADAWQDEANEHAQSIIDLLTRSGFACKKSESPDPTVEVKE